MDVRIGLPKTSGSLPGACFSIEAPALVSASCMWNAKKRVFRAPSFAICDLDIALDSAGYVAMKHYGGYPWTVEQYVELAGLWGWSWYAQMDFCCEPEIASNQFLIDARVWASAYNLAYCLKVARTWRDAGAFWLQDPMPVLQGWNPEDYVHCIKLYDAVLGGDWPKLVGVGSVCRRHSGGPDGVVRVVSAIANELPAHVGLHLFGVKGSALSDLVGLPVASMDSAAWQYRARMKALHDNISCTIRVKSAAMEHWYRKEQQNIKEPNQLRLNFEQI
jgi:hypothetical protein